MYIGERENIKKTHRLPWRRHRGLRWCSSLWWQDWRLARGWTCSGRWTGHRGPAVGGKFSQWKKNGVHFLYTIFTWYTTMCTPFLLGIFYFEQRKISSSNKKNMRCWNKIQWPWTTSRIFRKLRWNKILIQPPKSERSKKGNKSHVQQNYSANWGERRDGGIHHTNGCKKFASEKKAQRIFSRGVEMHLQPTENKRLTMHWRGNKKGGRKLNRLKRQQRVSRMK